MKKILRSVIDIESSIPEKDISKNLYLLSDANLDFVHTEDQQVWDFVKDYARTYTKPPTLISVRDHFERDKNLEVLDRIEEIRAVRNTYKKSDFENLVRASLKEQNERNTGFLITDASNILVNGMKVGKGKNETQYKGHRDALRYIMERADKYLMSDSGAVFRSDITKDSELVRKDLQKTLSNASNAWGRGTGLNEIDATCRGIKPGELWIHAASTGELKSTFALNWAYKTAFLFGYNVYYYSLEMPVEQLRLILYTMHSNHPKFAAMGYDPLSYRLIRDGVSSTGAKITPDEVDFYNLVIDDVEKGQKDGSYGALFVECPEEAETTMAMVKSRIELVHQTTPIHLVFIDYLSLLAGSRKGADRSEELNSIFREAKQMCLTFNRGERIPIVALHQINREGKKEADKNDGRYTTMALADSSSAERTADVITYTYLNPDYRANSETLIGCIKNRDNPHFDPFQAQIHFPSRFIRNLPTGQQNGSTGINLNLK
jgi:replicative DNA helicase